MSVMMSCQNRVKIHGKCGVGTLCLQYCSSPLTTALSHAFMFLLPTNTFPRQISKDLAGPKLMPHLQDTAKPRSHHLPSDK